MRVRVAIFSLVVRHERSRERVIIYDCALSVFDTVEERRRQEPMYSSAIYRYLIVGCALHIKNGVFRGFTTRQKLLNSGYFSLDELFGYCSKFDKI